MEWNWNSSQIWWEIHSRLQNISLAGSNVSVLVCRWDSQYINLHLFKGGVTYSTEWMYFPTMHLSTGVQARAGWMQHASSSSSSSPSFGELPVTRHVPHRGLCCNSTIIKVMQVRTCLSCDVATSILSGKRWEVGEAFAVSKSVWKLQHMMI